MRKLMWFTLGFGAACGLFVYLLPGETLPLLAITAAAGAAVLAILSRERTFLFRAVLVCLGVCGAFLWYRLFQNQYISCAASLDGQTQTVTMEVSDYSYETDYGSAVDGRMQIQGKTYQVRVYLKEKRNLEPGDRIAGQFRFRLTAPDGDGPGSYYSGKGIFLLAYQQDQLQVEAGEKTLLRDLPAVLRKDIKARIQSAFPEDAAPFAVALLLGDTSGLDYETDTNFQISGIRHVVAVSGLHVSILFALVMAVSFRKRFLTALVGIPVLALFAAVAGFSPSVNRACLMSGLMMLAMLFDKEYDGPTALSFACLTMLMVNPLTITNVGFQLSVASVAGIQLFSGRILGWMNRKLPVKKGKNIQARLIPWFASSVSVSLSAMTLTTPLCAWYFGAVSLIGAVTNLLTLWIISLIFYGITAVAVLQFVWQTGAAALAWLVSWPIRYVLISARILADAPLAAVYTRSVYVTFWLVFVYVLLTVFLISRKKRPVILSCCACLGLCLALMASWLEPLLDNTRITVLDVGQGQCVLLQTGGRVYMVDCGGSDDEEAADAAAETLLSQGITKLDGLILTHGDRDHAGGAAYFLSRINTALLMLPADSQLSDLDKGAGQTVYVTEETRLAFDGGEIRIFPPDDGGNSNEDSLCILFDTENCDILITGDRSASGERSLLKRMGRFDVDVLVAGHHGSKYAACEELLTAVSPEIVCISVGADNPYGHPAPETLERLRDFGCQIYRTDRHGTIVIRR